MISQEREERKTIPNLLEARCRYEREHSGSLLRDWHRTTENHPYAIVWLDDASYDARV